MDGPPDRGAAPVDGVWAPSRRSLTAGIVATVTLVAAEALAVVTVMPLVRDDLGGGRWYGWVFSSFMLGSLVGIVLAGRSADKRGPATPFAVGVALFSLGLVLAGLAPHLGVLAAARALQGVGAGAVPAVAYTSVGRGYPPELRPRMFAVISTAWVVPGLVGPGLAGLVGDHVGWRWVFLGLIPLVLVAAALALPALAKLGPGTPSDDQIGPDDQLGPGASTAGIAVLDACRVAVGAALVLAGLGSGSVPVLVVLAVGGVALGLAPLVRLLPDGTLRARPGLPAAVLARGMLTYAFFGVDAYMPLALTEVRGTSVTMAGLVVTAGTVSWTTGAWVQERLSRTWGPARLAHTGFGVLAVGIAVASLVLLDATPLALVPFMWMICGLGVGIAHAPLSVITLGAAPAGGEGAASAGLQLSDTLGIALGTGVGGALIAMGERGDGVTAGILGACFAIGVVVALAGFLVTRRLPRRPAAAPAS